MTSEGNNAVLPMTVGRLLFSHRMCNVGLLGNKLILFPMNLNISLSFASENIEILWTQD